MFDIFTYTLKSKVQFFQQIFSLQNILFMIYVFFSFFELIIHPVDKQVGGWLYVWWMLNFLKSFHSFCPIGPFSNQKIKFLHASSPLQASRKRLNPSFYNLDREFKIGPPLSHTLCTTTCFNRFIRYIFSKKKLPAFLMWNLKHI